MVTLKRWQWHLGSIHWLITLLGYKYRCQFNRSSFSKESQTHLRSSKKENKKKSVELTNLNYQRVWNSVTLLKIRIKHFLLYKRLKNKNKIIKCRRGQSSVLYFYLWFFKSMEILCQINHPMVSEQSKFQPLNWSKGLKTIICVGNIMQIQHMINMRSGVHSLLAVI